jgi:flavin reductase (DIM6/NTAB) family NADH-FMN oxidoreductase RutF
MGAKRMPPGVPFNDQLAEQTKLALRRLASAVAVVTCRDGQRRHAMTATAVNAMSMDPPSMIVCVNRSAAFHPAISLAARFAINILHRNQIEISIGCGGKARGEDRFGYGAWGEEAGVPILTDAQARVVCTKEAKFDYGSHTIFIGRVTSVGIHGEVDPLIYVDGKYTCLPPDAVAVSALQTEIEILRQLAM